MLLSASANRAKSWSCEHCQNWKEKDKNNCLSCYWAYPESYKHVAMRDIRRLDLLWSENEVIEYDKLIEEASKVKENAPEYVKKILRKHLHNKKS